MGPIEATRTCFSKYFTFSGRASRPEFWWFVLVYSISMALAYVIDVNLFGAGSTVTVAVDTDSAQSVASATHRNGPVEILVWLVFFFPLLAAAWRRMQDTGRPGVTLLVPILISLAAGAFLYLGVVGFALLEMIGLDGEFLRAFASALGVIGLGVALALYIAMRIMILVWLVRRGDKDANAYGLRPAL